MVALHNLLGLIHLKQSCNYFIHNRFDDCIQRVRHTHTHARTNAHKHARTHARTHARPHARTQASEQANTHGHTRTHARAHAHTHTHTVHASHDKLLLLGSRGSKFVLSPGCAHLNQLSTNCTSVFFEQSIRCEPGMGNE